MGYLRSTSVIQNKSLWGSVVTCGVRVSGHGLEDIAEGEAGFEAGYAGQAGEMVLVEAAVVVHTGDADDEHVIVLAGHEVATEDAFGFADRCLKCGEDGGRLAFKRDANEDGHALAEQAVVNLRVITADGAGGFKGLDAARGGRGGQASGFADFVVGGAAVALEMVQDGFVQLVESELATARRIFRRRFCGG